MTAFMTSELVDQGLERGMREHIANLLMVYLVSPDNGHMRLTNGLTKAIEAYQAARQCADEVLALQREITVMGPDG